MKDVPLVLYIGTAGPSHTTPPVQKNSKPEIYTYQPQTLACHIRFPVWCKSFIFPNNIEFNLDPVQQTSIHYFNFPDNHGRMFFGICCNFDLQVDHDMQNLLIQERIFNEDEANEVYADHSIFMLFSEPVHLYFVQFIDYYAKKIMNNEGDFSQIAETMYQYFPPQLKLPWHITFGDLSQSLTQVNKNQYEIEIKSINSYGHSVFPQTGLLFKRLSPELIADIIEALLQERTVILTSNNQQVNSQLVYELLGILYPFNYPYPFYSTLPQNYLNALHSPIPFFVSIHTMLLNGQTLTPHHILVDIQTSKIVRFQDYQKYGIKCRYCIPRRALAHLNSKFIYIIKRDEDAQRYLNNTMNYDQSDSQYQPENVTMKKNVITKKGVFKKEIINEYVDVDVKNLAQENTTEHTVTELSVTSGHEHKNNIKYLIPYSMCSKVVALYMEINDRLFYYQVIRDLNIRHEHSESTMSYKKLSVISQSDANISSSILNTSFAYQLVEQNNFVEKFNRLRVKLPDFSNQKAIKFVEEDYQSKYGFDVYRKPQLPKIIKKLLIVIIEQNSNYNKNSKPQQAKQILENEDNPSESMTLPDLNVYPNPMAMLLDALVVQSEQKHFDLHNDPQDYGKLVSVVQELQQHFDMFGYNIKQINQQLRDDIVHYVKNTPSNLVPSKTNKKTDIPRLRTGITAVLLLLVQHYRKSLQSYLVKKKTTITSVINLKQHEAEHTNIRQVYINENSEKIAMQYSKNNQPLQMLQDIYQRRQNEIYTHQIKQQDIHQTVPYSKIFDYRTFIAEAPTKLRQFLEYFAYSKIFQAFLETRLSDQVQNEGQWFFSLSKGEYYSQKYHTSSRSASTMTAGSSIARDANFSSIFNINKPSVDTKSQCEDSQTETNYELPHEQLDVDAHIEYYKIGSLDRCDLADLMLKNSKLINDGESALINERSVFDFLILKQGQSQVGTLKWSERLIQLKINQTPIQVSWRNINEPADKVRGVMKIINTQLVDIPQTNDYPTSFPISVQGVVERKGKEFDRQLVLCFQNAAEQHLFLLLCRQSYKAQTRERVRSQVVIDHINAVRKVRRLALGNLQYHLEKPHLDTSEWIITNADLE